MCIRRVSEINFIGYAQNQNIDMPTILISLETGKPKDLNMRSHLRLKKENHSLNVENKVPIIEINHG
jgi:hypothetical protein